ncbi:MAG: DUF4876 domain-containing protein [Paludibacteraceae bacterium]|nr:DUF4876 domain-containing protein [Paludibacteraceae bacterium]
MHTQNIQTRTSAAHSMLHIPHILTIVLLLLCCAACNQETPLTAETDVEITVQLPQGISASQIQSLQITAHNVNTGHDTPLAITPTDSCTYETRMTEGFYDLSLTGLILLSDTARTTISMQGYTAANAIKGEGCKVRIETHVVNPSNDFVIAEIFFTGTLTPEGKQYNGDKYFRIYNNSDSIRYADGLILMESDFLTVNKYDFQPDIMNEAMTVNALYRIPGNGTDVPVGPHKSLLIADNAIDHRQANPNSFDLSTADFEWYDVSTNANIVDIDNPLVPNLEKIYCYTLTIWVPHNRGFTAFALGRLPHDMTVEEYLQRGWYTYEYDLYTSAGVSHMSQSAYRFENDWIIDAVNCSVEAKFQGLVTATSLDCGWTHCGTIDKDKTRYGKSVRRRTVALDADGRPILQDTNNSSVDFLPEQQADPFYFQ